MFLTDDIFNSADVLALVGIGGVAVGAQRLVNRRMREREPGLSEREYTTGRSLTAWSGACADSLERSRSRRGLA